VIRIHDHLAGDEVRFHCAESPRDLREVQDFVMMNPVLALDTEGTGLNCYRPDWRMRTFQLGDATDAYVIPAQFKKFIWWVMKSDTRWIGHNGPYDIRCTDRHLGRRTRVVCAETHIPSHHRDSRGQREGGIGHGLKELSVGLVDRNADKWEKALKAAFKKIIIPIEGQVYKSGPRKGTQKFRKAKMSEGWGLIDLFHPAYIAYAGADPLLTFRLRDKLKPVVDEFRDLYKFDHELALACDTLQRRGIRLDINYTKRLSAAYLRKANKLQQRVAESGCDNINSTAQIADALLSMGVKLTETTDTGKWKVDADLLRKLLEDPYANAKVKDFIHCLLVAKQVLKRRTTYAEGMLRERDENGRVHPSINSLAARTARMSAGIFQQLPTKDRESEELWESEDEL
jgi:DNA polymerase-1